MRNQKRKLVINPEWKPENFFAPNSLWFLLTGHDDELYLVPDNLVDAFWLSQDNYHKGYPHWWVDRFRYNRSHVTGSPKIEEFL